MYRHAISRFSFTPLPYLGLYETLRDLNRLPDAQRILLDGITKFPDDARLQVAYAVTLRRLGDRLASLESLNVVTTKYPRHIPAALERANSLKSLGHDEQALAAYEAILEAAPYSLQARVAKASLLAISNRFAEAIEVIKEITADTQVGWRAENLRALIELRSGKISDAKKRVERGLETVLFDRERRVLRSTLASILVKEHSPQSAVEVLKRPDPIDDEITRIVRLHAAAFLERTAATKAFRDTKDVTGPLSVIREQIGVQLGLVKHGPLQSKGWLEENLQLAILREVA
ncbi:hypothetical protein Q9L58_010943 [Maublancomyces gigas]|uniref:Tetratricopeptide repeat protein n=1 Tax=Discina gigas TaxID=1032678 RepID=A0ABR3G328_9PEZI